eukprot:Gb_26810 [translate_table: standard]
MRAHALIYSSYLLSGEATGGEGRDEAGRGRGGRRGRAGEERREGARGEERGSRAGRRTESKSPALINLHLWCKLIRASTHPRHGEHRVHFLNVADLNVTCLKRLWTLLHQLPQGASQWPNKAV